MNKHSLIEGLRNHDKATIKYIFAQYFPMILDLVRKNGAGTSPQAEDLFMNGLEVLYLKAQEEDFKLTCSFSTILYEICRRQWLSTLRRNNRITNLSDELQHHLVAEDFSTALEKSERYDLYREYFDKLSCGCQEVLKLVLNGMSMENVATKLGFASAQYARKRKYSCKEKLMRLIKSDPRYQELAPYDESTEV